MSVLVRETKGKQRVILLCKGADATIIPIISQDWAESEEGLSTMETAQAHLSEFF